MSEEDGKDKSSPENDIQEPSLDGLKAENEKLQAELKKLKDKDLNFEKVRNMTEEEKKKFNEEKSGLEGQIAELKGQIEKGQQQQVDDWMESAIKAAVGNDAEKAKKIREEYEILNLPASSREEVAARTEKAIRLAGYELKGDKAGFGFGAGRDVPKKKENRFSDTEEGQRLLKTLAPDLAKTIKSE